MDNIVALERDRPRRRRMLDLPGGGARILFFTGVRYCRDEDAAPAGLPDAHVIRDRQLRVESGLALDLAAH